MSKLWIAITMIFSWQAFGHGEAVPGPNRGYIRMPGSFHIEVVPHENEAIAVYLLDMGFKNPVSKNSFVEAKISGKDNLENLSCRPESAFFLCKLPAKRDLKQGNLEIASTRNGVKGIPVKYSLPLRYDGDM